MSKTLKLNLEPLWWKWAGLEFRHLIPPSMQKHRTTGSSDDTTELFVVHRHTVQNHWEQWWHHWTVCRPPSYSSEILFPPHSHHGISGTIKLNWLQLIKCHYHKCKKIGGFSSGKGCRVFIFVKWYRFLGWLLSATTLHTSVSITPYPTFSNLPHPHNTHFHQYYSLSYS